MSRNFLGVHIDAVYHTALVFGGIEYFFGAGVQTSYPGATHHGRPMEIIPMGRTELPLEIILEYLESLKEIYTVEVCLTIAEVATFRRYIQANRVSIVIRPLYAQLQQLYQRLRNVLARKGHTRSHNFLTSNRARYAFRADAEASAGCSYSWCDASSSSGIIYASA